MIRSFEHLPLMEVGQVPGDYVDDPIKKTSTWHGVVSWRTGHGHATMQWLLGKRHAVWGARLPTGEVIDYAEIAEPYKQESWLRKNPDCEGFIRGSVTVLADGILFTDKPRRNYTIADAESELERDLANDRLFCLQLRRPGIASAAYEYLRSTSFRRDGDDEGRWICSSRFAAGILARIRDIGETYLAFYPDGGDFSKEDTLAFEETLERIQWHALTPEEYAADHEKALSILDATAGRASGSISENDRPKVIPLNSAMLSREHPVDRMHNAAQDGRVTQQEFLRFFALADLTNERAGAIVQPAHKLEA